MIAAGSGVVGEQLTILLNNEREQNKAGLGVDRTLERHINDLTMAWIETRRAELRFKPVPGEREIAEALNFPSRSVSVAL